MVANGHSSLRVTKGAAEIRLSVELPATNDKPVSVAILRSEATTHLPTYVNGHELLQLSFCSTRRCFSPRGSR